MTDPHDDDDDVLALVKRQLFDLEQDIRSAPMLDEHGALMREHWADKVAKIREFARRHREVTP